MCFSLRQIFGILLAWWPEEFTGTFAGSNELVLVSSTKLMVVVSESS